MLGLKTYHAVCTTMVTKHWQHTVHSVQFLHRMASVSVPVTRLAKVYRLSVWTASQLVGVFASDSMECHNDNLIMQAAVKVITERFRQPLWAPL